MHQHAQPCGRRDDGVPDQTSIYLKDVHHPLYNSPHEDKNEVGRQKWSMGCISRIQDGGTLAWITT